jgi:RNA polymerase sigma-70 factor (sigma-E family)
VSYLVKEVAMTGSDPGLEFASFVRSHSTALYRAAYLLTRDAAAAEDLVQETFTRLLPVWPRVMQAEAPFGYVRRSMVNLFLNGKRSRSGHELLFADTPERPSVRDLASDVTDQTMVRQLLDRLPPRPRAVLVWKFIYDLSDADIAAELGCRPSTVRSIISRAVRGLQLEMAGEAS